MRILAIAQTRHVTENAVLLQTTVHCLSETPGKKAVFLEIQLTVGLHSAFCKSGMGVDSIHARLLNVCNVFVCIRVYTVYRDVKTTHFFAHFHQILIKAAFRI